MPGIVVHIKKKKIPPQLRCTLGNVVHWFEYLSKKLGKASLYSKSDSFQKLVKVYLRNTCNLLDTQ